MTSIPEKKLKILVCIDWFAPGYKAGGPIQSCRNMVQALKEDFEFYIYTSDRDLGDQSSYTTVPLNQWVDYQSSAKIWYHSPEGKEGFLSILKSVKPDVVYFNNMFSVGYTLKPLFKLLQTGYKGKIVLAPRGMLHEGALKLKFLKKKIFLSLLNFSGIPSKIVFQATDTQEEKDIRKHFPNCKGIIYAGNIPAPASTIINNQLKVKGELKLVFLSRIQEKKNLLFVLETLLDFQNGNFRLDIYGSSEDDNYLNRCKSIIENLPANILVDFKGPVDNSRVADVLSHYHLFVLPTYGENFGHAIFESLLVGTPVLISDRTPWRNLEEKKAGWDVPLEDKEKYSFVIKKMLEADETEFKRLSEGAIRLAKDYALNLNYREEYRKLFMHEG